VNALLGGQVDYITNLSVASTAQLEAGGITASVTEAVVGTPS